MGLEGIDQLRELMKGQVEQELNGLTRTHMKRQLLDQLAESHDFEVPASMVEAEFEQIWQQLEQEAGQEEDPQAARAEMEKRARGLSRHRRAPGPARPAALRDRHPNASRSTRMR